MNVLYVDHTPFWGGAERVLETHISLLDKSQITPFVVISKKNKQFASRYREAGAEVFTISFGKLKSINPFVLVRFCSTVEHLVRIINEKGIEIVVSNTSRAYYPAVLAAKLCHIPLVAWIHDFLYIKPLFKFFSLFTTGFIWTSRTVMKFYGQTENKISKVIYAENIFLNELDNVEEESVLALRHEWGLAPDEVAVGFVGRLVEWKGVHILVEAINVLREKYRTGEFKLIILGSGKGQEGDNEPAIMELVERLDLSEKVVFTGFQKHTAPFYKAFDIFVLPSISRLNLESYPTVLVEAMLAGKPIVATTNGGTVEIVADKKTGFLLPSEDPEALAEKLAQLVGNVELRNRLGDNGRKRALQLSAGIGNTKKIKQFLEELSSTKLL